MPVASSNGTSAQRRIVVIGSGFGGLATAIRLQSRGYQVDLIEARDMLGGRAYVYRQDGFTFDAGLTVITAPFMIDDIFAQAGRTTADYVKIVPVDPFYRIEFHNGRHFEYNNDEAETEQRVAAFSPGDLAGYKEMIRQAKAISQKGFLELSDKPFLKFQDMLPIDTKEPVIHTMSYFDRVRRAGDALLVGGVSFAGVRGVRQVRIRAGRGSWVNADLDTPLSPYALTRWKARLFAATGAIMLEARAMDGDGRWQAVREKPLFPDGVSGPTIKKLS